MVLKNQFFESVRNRKRDPLYRLAAFTYDEYRLGYKQSYINVFGKREMNSRKKFINDNERIALRIIKYALMYYGNMSKEEVLDGFNKELSELFGLEAIVNKIKIPSEYDSNSKYHYIALKITGSKK